MTEGNPVVFVFRYIRYLSLRRNQQENERRKREKEKRTLHLVLRELE